VQGDGPPGADEFFPVLVIVLLRAQVGAVCTLW
jgi:hypothetical protein